MLYAFVALVVASLASAQEPGQYTPEVHPPITFQTCTRNGGCTIANGGVVLDANYRWVHKVGDYVPCLGDSTLCPDAATCAQNCALEGADYAGTYAITTSGSSLNLTFGNGGSRVYLMDSDNTYKNFHVLNQEFSFDVDVSQLPCGFNGALYFSEMPPDGGASAVNTAGAKYGTGYCDAQCPRGVNFFNGTANFDGSLGSCCNEMDLWEANSMATALTPHPCNVTGAFPCTGSACSNLCDPNGCDFNPFRMGNHTLFGPGGAVDTTKPFTVVTQFITYGNKPTSALVQINRLYVQNGRIITNSHVNIPNMAYQNSITADFCTAKEKAFGESPLFDNHGGLAQMGESLQRGAVLVMSLWNDLGGGMTWLDGLVGSNSSAPGALRGACTGPVSANPQASVVFSNIRVGDFGSTFAQPSSPALHFGQCDGYYYFGPNVCPVGTACQYNTQWYSQCL